MAQAAKPKDPKEEAAAAEATAAMERARRQAANPMRIILEASKAKRRPDEAPAAAETSVRPVVNRTTPPAATVPPEVTTRSVSLPPAAQPAALAQPVAAPVPAPAPAVTAPVQEPAVTLSSDALKAKAASPVPALAPGNAPVVSPAAVPAAPLAVPAAAVAVARPKLVSMVEPELPQRLLDDLGRNATVTVDLTIRPDGTVGDVAVVGVSPRGLQRALSNALEQWRFSPVPAPYRHRVELVFNSDGR
jgi:hypothetical protein